MSTTTKSHAKTKLTITVALEPCGLFVASSEDAAYLSRSDRFDEALGLCRLSVQASSSCAKPIHVELPYGRLPYVAFTDHEAAERAEGQTEADAVGAFLRRHHDLAGVCLVVTSCEQGA